MDKKIDIANLPELARNLDPILGESNTADSLCATSEGLLSSRAIETTINGIPSLVSPWACEVPFGERTLHARIAKLKKPQEGNELPIIIFGDKPGPNITTTNLFALRFKESAVGDVSLMTQNGLDPLLDDERYVELARTIIDDISSQYTQDNLARQARKHRISKAVKAYFMDNERPYYHSSFDTIGERRRVTLGASILALVLSYGHLPFGNVDAKIGPVPMPYPVEAVVDIDNRSDHAALGFNEPQQGVELRIGDKNVRLPLLDSYDTSGVPDATFSNGTSMKADDFELSKPGLYKVEFVSSVREGECETVRGDYRNGVSKAFTQDSTIVDNVRLNVKSAKELDVCAVADVNFTGSLYVWQEK